MSLFDEYAKDYNIADQEFTLVLTGAEVLALMALIQLGKATSPPDGFQKNFAEVFSIAEEIINVVSEIDPLAGVQLRSGWEL